MKRFAVVAALLLLTRSLAAQQADSAAVYSRIVAEHPDNSRAVFRLAALQPRGSAQAISLYERYTRLEPGDAWGYLALAEAQAAANHFDAALRNVQRASELAPRAEDVDVVKHRIQRARRNSVPVLAPRTSYTGDTDGNKLLQVTLGGDVTSGVQSRFGVSGTHAHGSDDFEAYNADEGQAYMRSRSATSQLELSAGAARVQATTTQTTGIGRARLRVMGKNGGPLFDLRATRAPLLVSPLLMVNHVVLSEARGTLELPLGKVLRVRGNGQIGDLASQDIDTVTFLSGGGGRGRGGTPMTRTALSVATSHNRRLGFGGSLVARTGAASELSAGYYQLSYDAASRAGYYAPREVQMAELGTYAEIYKFDPLTISLDAGAGAQRSAPQGGVFGNWTPAFRLWGLVTAPIARAVEVDAETDIYKSQLSTVATTSSWASTSFSLGIRWLIGY